MSVMLHAHLTKLTQVSNVISNTLKWTGMRHLHTPYLHIHYYTLHLTRVSSPFCALPQSQHTHLSLVIYQVYP